MRFTMLFLIVACGSFAPAAADLPDGYRWHREEGLHGSFAVPQGWRVHGGAESPWRTLSITKPETEGAPYPTDLTVGYAGGVTSTLGKPPSEYAEQRMAGALSRHRPLAASRGRDGGYSWFDYTVQIESAEDPERIDAIRRVRMLADDALDRIYVFAFESSPDEWIRTRSIRAVLLRGDGLD